MEDYGNADDKGSDQGNNQLCVQGVHILAVTEFYHLNARPLV